MQPAELLLRLRETTIELGQLHNELATIRVAEARAKTETYRQAMQDGMTSVSATEKLAQSHAIDFTCDLITVQGRIAAHREEKDFLLAALEVAQSESNTNQ